MSTEFEEEEVIEQPVPMGGKRKSKRRVNPALGKWVAFVKKVQKEEKISYKEAMTRAKARKDKGEKWMGGGLLLGGEMEEEDVDVVMEDNMGDMEDMEGGRRRRKRGRRTKKRRGSKKRRHSRRHRGGGSNLLKKYN